MNRASFLHFVVKVSASTTQSLLWNRIELGNKNDIQRWVRGLLLWWKLTWPGFRQSLFFQHGSVEVKHILIKTDCGAVEAQSTENNKKENFETRVPASVSGQEEKVVKWERFWKNFSFLNVNLQNVGKTCPFWWRCPKKCCTLHMGNKLFCHHTCLQ